MNVVIDWLREQGHLVLLEGARGYTVDDDYYNCFGLLALANRLRRKQGLANFPRHLAQPTHRNRRRQRGSLMVLIGGEL
jgi:hypothetical protein